MQGGASAHSYIFERALVLIVPDVAFPRDDRSGCWSYPPCKVAANFKAHDYRKNLTNFALHGKAGTMCEIV